MRKVLATIVAVRSAEYPLYMTTDEIRERLLEKAKATFNDGNTSVSVGVVELPEEHPPQPVGD